MRLLDRMLKVLHANGHKVSLALSCMPMATRSLLRCLALFCSVAHVMWSQGVLQCVAMCCSAFCANGQRVDVSVCVCPCQVCTCECKHEWVFLHVCVCLFECIWCRQIAWIWCSYGAARSHAQTCQDTSCVVACCSVLQRVVVCCSV